MSTPFRRFFNHRLVRSLALALPLALAASLQSCGGRDEETPAQPGMTPGEARDLQSQEQPATPGAPVAPTPATPGAPVTPTPPTPGVPAPAAPGAPAPTATPGAPAAAPAAPGTPQAAGPVNPGKLLPVDEARRAPGLADFRNRLQQAVKERNRELIVSALAPNVGTDGQQGIDAFRKAWDLDNPNSRFWQELGNVLRQGGSFGQEGNTNVFYAPHVYGRLPQGLDPAQYGVITGERVNVRKSPSRTGESAGQLTYEIVKLAPNPNPQTETIEGETHPWVPIIMPDGSTGYVYGRYIRSPRGLHARFERVDNEWKLTYFGEGR